MSSNEPDDSHEQATGLRFLFTGDDGEPFRRTQCWIMREPGNSMDDWSLHLTQPEVEAFEINDLKQWVLFKSEEHRLPDTDVSKSRGS